ncbi:MAG: 50S ribosomal protein L11 methyltransferase [Inquilinaceae bacterium]
MIAAWRLSLTVPTIAVDAFESVLADCCASVSADVDDEESPTGRMEGIATARPDLSAIGVRLALAARASGVAEPVLTVVRVPPTDWLQATYQAFPPVRVGRFFIHGSHHEGQVPASAMGLRIDAATAFGTGEHPTTEGCLRALERLAKRRRVRRPLDMGCGTGILSFAAARLWPAARIVASDVDGEAARVAGVNARVNRLKGRIAVHRGPGYRDPAIGRAGPYDLIIANILARPLAEMAPALARHLTPGGTVVLSGLLERQERFVLAAHRRHGLVLERRLRVKGWSTLVLRRRGQGGALPRLRTSVAS